MKEKMYFIPLGLVIFCIIVATVVRFSYTNCGNEIYTYTFAATIPSTNKILSKNNITTVDDLINQSDIIVKCKYSGYRQITSDAFYSEVLISDVYKGDKSLIGKNINIIENVYTFPENRYLNSIDGYIPLQVNVEYLLILKHAQFDKLRHLSDFENKEYYVLTNSPFGSYRVTQTQSGLVNSNINMTLKTIKDLDIVTNDKKVLDIYNSYRNGIISKFR
jgi:hypothetical protein